MEKFHCWMILRTLLVIQGINSCYGAEDPFAITPTTRAGTALTPEFRFSLREGLLAINASSRSIQAAIPNWYSYSYDSRSMITDGGNDMYDQGNKIVVAETLAKKEKIDVFYNRYYKYEGFEFMSLGFHPFVALLKIDNYRAIEHRFKIQVVGNAGADGAGQLTTFKGNATKENFTAEYHVFQVSNATDPTICEVYFIIYSEQNWLSIKPDNFTAIFGSDTNILDNTVEISGSPSRMIMGYTLLSRYPTSVITNDEVMEVMLAYMDVLGKMNSGCEQGRHHCHEYAICHNNFYNYTCECIPGLIGDGVRCEDVDECQNVTYAQTCDSRATCVNMVGSYSCVCADGYIGNGTTCRDFDECSIPSSCDQNAVCSNAIGSFSCECKNGFYSNGNRCEETVKLFDVKCNFDSIVTRIHSSYYLSRNIALADLHLSDYSCKGYEDPKTPEVWIFPIPSFSSCSTAFFNNGTHLKYTNSISNTVPGSMVYTGSGTFSVISCIYEKSLRNISLFSTQYRVIQNIANLTIPTRTGHFLAALNHYTDGSYSKREVKREFSTTDTLYFMVGLLTRDETLHLVIDNCWVTSSPQVDDPNQFLFIQDGCPVPVDGNDASVQVTRSGNGTTASFQTQVFAFIDHDVTFLHCAMSICSSTNSIDCIPVCLLHNESANDRATGVLQRKRRTSGAYEENKVVSLGPLYLIQKENRKRLFTTEQLVIFSNVVLIFIMIFMFVMMVLYCKLVHRESLWPASSNPS